MKTVEILLPSGHVQVWNVTHNEGIVVAVCPVPSHSTNETVLSQNGTQQGVRSLGMEIAYKGAL